ncbi:hypothetical protein BKA62DRAFT_609708 [Auriculariales sp. MPI-PUGE-AT-0066]|nr:hypothetical protein BKA62DRAFT_609708 [Auriculariales sp. MPI-PUGE-AT-0066]
MSDEEISADPIVLVACGGDGTVHEIVNAILRPVVDLAVRIPPIALVIVPAGTANALYASLFPETAEPRYSAQGLDEQLVRQLQSVLSFTQSNGTGQQQHQQLSVSRTQVRAADGELWHDLFAFVVTSTSFHASLLDTAEELRKDVPRLSRFGQAARANINKIYNARATLLPSPAGPPRIYDPATQQFVATTSVELEGPFSYFLSTLNVDRLEPSFRVAPLHRSHPPAPGEMDLIVLRPGRNPVHGAARTNSALSTQVVMAKAYEDGAHVALRFDPDGVPTMDADGPYLVEYFRCGGWKWIPDASDEHAHLVCVDGTIARVPQEEGGSAVCMMLQREFRCSVFV